MAEHNDTGRWGEQVACDHLRRHGYTIRARNWHCGHRDLDIVALSGDMTTLVIVEVKTRSRGCVVRPEDAIDRKKIRNIGIATDAYVKQNGIRLDLRFDIVTVVGNRTGKEEPLVEHWEDAFSPMLAY